MGGCSNKTKQQQHQQQQPNIIYDFISQKKAPRIGYEFDLEVSSDTEVCSSIIRIYFDLSKIDILTCPSCTNGIPKCFDVVLFVCFPLASLLYINNSALGNVH